MPAGNMQLPIQITAEGRVDQVVRQINEQLKPLGQSLTPVNKQFKEGEQHLGASRQHLAEMRDSVSEIARKFTEISPPLALLGGLGSIAGIGELLDHTARLGTELAITSTNLGLTTGELQGFRGGAALSAVSTQAMTGALGGLQAKLYGAAWGRDAQAIAVFRQFGIAARDTNGHIRSVKDVLPEVAAAVANQRDPYVQAAIATAMLGDRGAELLPYLRRGRDGIAELNAEMRRYGAEMTPQAIRASDLLHEAQTRLEFAVRGVANAMLERWGPSFAQGTERMAEWIGELRKSPEAMRAIEMGGIALSGVIGLTMVAAIAKLGAKVVSVNSALLATPLGRLLLLGAVGFEAATGGPGSAAQPEGLPGGDWSKWLDLRYLTRRLMGGAREAPATPAAPNASRPGSLGALNPISGAQAAPMPGFHAGAPAPGTGADESVIRDTISRAGKNVGLTQDQIRMAQAGFLSNFAFESNLRHDLTRKGGTDTGWAQWVGPRLRHMASYGDPHSLEANRQQLYYELTGPYRGFLIRAGKAANPRQAAEAAHYFESGGAPQFEGAVKQGHIAQADAFYRKAAAEGPPRSPFPPWVKFNSKGEAYSPDLQTMSAAERENVKRSMSAIHDTRWADRPQIALPSPLAPAPIAVPSPSQGQSAAAPGDGQRSAAPEVDTAGIAAAAQSRHEVLVEFANAPAGLRSGLRAGNGPADFELKTQYAMASGL